MISREDPQYEDLMVEAFRALHQVTWLSNVEALVLIQAIRGLNPGESYTIRRADNPPQGV